MEYGVLVMALMGFAVSLSSTQQATRNGVVTSCSYTNLAAIVFGIGTIAGSVWCANSYRNRNNNRWANVAVRARIDHLTLGIAVIGLVIGVVHVLRGAGILFSPCD